ncbi:hypothetical protein GCM10029978_074310 [Actinoallomurus acanthiterrae]
MTAPDHDPIPYAVVTSQELNEIAAATARVTLYPDEQRPVDIEVSGPCPACRGGTVHIEPVELVRASNAGGEAEVEAICACAFTHPDSPDGATGCGRSWRLLVAWDGQ